jgi:hypothetical protein
MASARDIFTKFFLQNAAATNSKPAIDLFNDFFFKHDAAAATTQPPGPRTGGNKRQTLRQQVETLTNENRKLSEENQQLTEKLKGIRIDFRKQVEETERLRDRIPTVQTESTVENEAFVLRVKVSTGSRKRPSDADHEDESKAEAKKVKTNTSLAEND